MTVIDEGDFQGCELREGAYTQFAGEDPEYGWGQTSTQVVTFDSVWRIAVTCRSWTQEPIQLETETGGLEGRRLQLVGVTHEADLPPNDTANVFVPSASWNLGGDALTFIVAVNYTRILNQIPTEDLITKITSALPGWARVLSNGVDGIFCYWAWDVSVGLEGGDIAWTLRQG